MLILEVFRVLQQRKWKLKHYIHVSLFHQTTEEENYNTKIQDLCYVSAHFQN